MLSSMRAVSTLALTVALTLSTYVLAGPAPFYLWQSKTQGHLSCAQTTPGNGWQRFAGPFKDAGCKEMRRP